MRKYIHGDKTSWNFVLGNGDRDFRGWPIDLTVSSYGWVTNKNKKGISEGWADNDIQIGPLRLTWTFSFTKFNISVGFQWEFFRRGNY